MTTQTQTGEVDQTPQGTNDNGAKSKDDALADIVAERDKLKRQLRELGKDSETLKTLQKQVEDLTVEKSKLAEEYDGFKQTVRKAQVETHVATALAAAGAKNPATVRKLLNDADIKFGDDGQVVQESIAEMINAVKTSDPYLFAEADVDPKKGTSTPTTTTSQVPDVKRVAGNPTGDAFAVELEAAKKLKGPEAFKAIEATLKKYGKI